ncbi:hypothetical protein RYX45_01555 [Alkalihalophilus pseudofirmus]|uniref:Uncharacterized protein n=1 Tax=Alkalihalophilus pseudofirmus TaxID=79885 RepID=A0AAJ2NJZ6_ALKPS|nr:hypothetical protein [Alkalihalophilus pseudofirmus]MDV2883849.1 hypothetical protein [Alkalihalophilus pseudofirmus]
MINDDLTIKYALSKSPVNDLKQLTRRFNSGPIDPKALKTQLIEELAPVIPDEYKEEIVSSVFYKPSYRQLAFLSNYIDEFPSEDELSNLLFEFAGSSDYDEAIPSYKPNEKDGIEFKSYNNNEVSFIYIYYKRYPDYDIESMETILRVKRSIVRVVFNLNKKSATFFSGDKDIFNKAMNAFNKALNIKILPLDINTTGITNATSGSFSFHTVKVIDFIYNGLKGLGAHGGIREIKLDTPPGSKEKQKVKVQGNDLLEDKSICEYLLIHKRDLIEVKLSFLYGGGVNKVRMNLTIGFQDNRIKFGINKDNFTIAELNKYFVDFQEKINDSMSIRGLISEENTKLILDKIRDKALGTTK